MTHLIANAHSILVDILGRSILNCYLTQAVIEISELFYEKNFGFFLTTNQVDGADGKQQLLWSTVVIWLTVASAAIMANIV